MLEVIIVTPEKVIYEGKAKSVIFPGENGTFEAQAYHKPLISRLISGKLIIDEKIISIRRGIVGINRNKATVIVEE